MTSSAFLTQSDGAGVRQPRGGSSSSCRDFASLIGAVSSRSGASCELLTVARCIAVSSRPVYQIRIADDQFPCATSASAEAGYSEGWLHGLPDFQDKGFETVATMSLLY